MQVCMQQRLLADISAETVQIFTGSHARLLSTTPTIERRDKAEVAQVFGGQATNIAYPSSTAKAHLADLHALFDDRQFYDLFFCEFRADSASFDHTRKRQATALPQPAKRSKC